MILTSATSTKSWSRQITIYDTQAAFYHARDDGEDIFAYPPKVVGW